MRELLQLPKPCDFRGVTVIDLHRISLAMSTIVINILLAKSREGLRCQARRIYDFWIRVIFGELFCSIREAEPSDPTQKKLHLGN